MVKFSLPNLPWNDFTTSSKANAIVRGYIKNEYLMERTLIPYYLITGLLLALILIQPSCSSDLQIKCRTEIFAA